MEVSENKTENSQQDKADNINIITDSNDDTPNVNNSAKNPSYISDYNLFNGNNNNYNNIFNNSYDSDTSNHSFHSVKTPHPYQNSRSSSNNIFLFNNELNEFNEIKNGLEEQKQDNNNSIIRSNSNNFNYYSSFSPLRPKIVQKTRYSGKNLSHFNIYNYKSNSNSNHNHSINHPPPNINNGKSNFSTFIRCNSTNINNNNTTNFFNGITNSFSSQNNHNNNILNSPIVNHNNSNLNALNISNSFSLTQGADKEFFTPQYHKKQKKKSLDIPRNKIHLESILRQKDKRTTIMIRHIPNKYTLKLFNDEINKSFANKYDLLYLPVDADNHCNLGFGFINFVDPIHIIDFYDRYFGKKWEKFNSDKICELAYAKVQGKEELLNHIIQGGVTNCTDMPVYLTYDIKIDKNNSSIELPIKYLQAFLNFYPYSLYRIVSYDRFIVDSFYNF